MSRDRTHPLDKILRRKRGLSVDLSDRINLITYQNAPINSKLHVLVVS
jgi:hypothetical protein